MPLVALVDGVPTTSLALTGEEWVALQGAVRHREVAVTLPCGLPGHLRRSVLGTPFFAHNPGSGRCGGHGRETPQHLSAKAAIWQAATDAGWTATPEARGPGWVADVLAERDSHRVAFEVQWSQRSEDEYRRRQEKYRASGVRCAWFARHEASVVPPDSDLPVFRLQDGDADGGDLAVELGGQVMPLRDAVLLLLGGRVRFREWVTGSEVTPARADLHRADCYRCSTPYLIWQVASETVTGPCGVVAEPEDTGEVWQTDRPEAAPEVRKAVSLAGRRHPWPCARLSVRSTRMSGTSYMTFACPECGGVFGDLFLRSFLSGGGHPVDQVTVPGHARSARHPHWCVDSGDGHCAVPASSSAGRDAMAVQPPREQAKAPAAAADSAPVETEAAPGAGEPGESMKAEAAAAMAARATPCRRCGHVANYHGTVTGCSMCSCWAMAR